MSINNSVTSWARQPSSSFSRMHVMNHNWSATKQRLHLQSVAQISRHLVLSGDRIRQCGTSSGSCTTVITGNRVRRSMSSNDSRRREVMEQM